SVFSVRRRPLAPAAEERKIQPQPDRARVEQLHDRRVLLELRPVALAFVVEKALEPCAFVLREFEVDDPARSRFIDEGTVEHDAARRLLANRGQSVFALRLALIGCEEPARARIVERAAQRGLNSLRRDLELRGGDAFLRELGREPGAQPADARFGPAL